MKGKLKMIPMTQRSAVQRLLPFTLALSCHQKTARAVPWKAARASLQRGIIEIPKATGQMSPREENMLEAKNYRSQVEEIKKLAEDAMQAALADAKSTGGSSEDELTNSDTAEIQQRLQSAIDEMQVGLVERDTEVRLMLLAALSGEHILFIGPPGTAKSELGRRLSRIYKGTFFERLLTRFSVPEELFGPLSMKELENDKYVRQTKGYLPEASVAFVDEIFKANSAILNTLLTILNERLFDNGSERHPVPLTCMVGASNELPESEELDALYDRFLIRRRVQQVSTTGLVDLLADPNLTEEPLLQGSNSNTDSILDLSQDMFRNIRRDAIRTVTVPEDVKQLLVDVRIYLQDRCNPPVYVSDRRLLKSVVLLKVAAYTSGRRSVSPYDCLLLQHVLWQDPEQSERIREFLISQLAADERTIEQSDYLFKGMFARACQLPANNKEKEEKASAVQELLSEVQAMKSMLVSKMASIYQNTSEEPGTATPSIWSSPDDQDAVATALSPKLMKAQGGVTELLYEVVTLEVLLTKDQQNEMLLFMADCFQKRWAYFIREGSMEDARNYGTRPRNPTQNKFAAPP